MGVPKYEWPPIEGLLEFTRKHGVREAARRLGCPVTTLRSHFDKFDLKAADYSPPQGLDSDALKEIHELIS
jgi:hypothetical protein